MLIVRLKCMPFVTTLHIYTFACIFTIFLGTSSFLQWTQQNVNDISLYQLNLRNNEVITLTSSRSNRRKRNIDIATVDITKALAWDPFTQQVYLCDVNTGNINVCNVSATEVTNCDIAVNGSIGNGVSNGTYYIIV